MRLKIPEVVVPASGGQQHTADKDQQNLGTVAGLEVVRQVSLASVLAGWLLAFWKDQVQELVTYEKQAMEIVVPDELLQRGLAMMNQLTDWEMAS